MNLGFWGEIKKPVFVLAPMADVTDAAFRRVIAKCGKPDVTWTEFVSADGLCSVGRPKLLPDLRFTEEERPIVAQLFSSTPTKMEEAARLCAELGFDGIDINMGCPDKTIEKQGAGAAMIKNPEGAKEIIRAAKRGAGKLPVSVKTRVGYNKNEIDTWILALLEEDIALLTLHARTRKEMSKVPAHWGDVKRVVALRNSMGKETLIFGNGDVKNLQDARARVEETGCDGVMIGRGIFGNPWLFAEKHPTLKEKLMVMVEHTKLFEELMQGVKSFALMKKHYKAYVEGFPGAHELRTTLMEAENASDVETIVNTFLQKDRVA
jgi:nifR3 family TIM-barrel protein